MTLQPSQPVSSAPHAAEWNDYSFVVQMPHLAPGEKLSEVEFLKLLAAYQWESIARALHRRPSEIVSEHGERLYGSVLDTELCLADGYDLERLGEDAEIHVRSRVRFFAKKFVEGFFVIDDAPIPDALLAGVERRADLPGTGRCWAAMTNVFIARAGGNLRLKVYKPAGTEALELAELVAPPFGVTEQARVQQTGEIDALDESDARAVPLRPTDDAPIRYTIVPESDLNGAGLVYFARYEAMMNYGERRFLMERLGRPLSRELVAHLSTEHRKVFFFANTSPDDEVEIYVSAALLGREHFSAPPASRGLRVPFKLLFRIDLHRGSDKQLMASSLVRKALHVPGGLKAVLAECERLFARLG